MKHTIQLSIICMLVLFIFTTPSIAQDNPKPMQAVNSGNNLDRIDALFEKGLAESYQHSGLEQFKESLDLCMTCLEKASDDYEVLWRCSRSAAEYAETAMGLNVDGWKDICHKWGKKGMEMAETAQKINPNKVDAYFWQVASIGKYANATGIFTAIKEGFLQKSKSSIARAYELDKTYYDYSPVNAKAMFNFTLPWPMKDKKKALKYFREFQAKASWSFEPHIRLPYAARLLMSYKKKAYDEEAKKLLEKALAAPHQQQHYHELSLELMKKLKKRY